MQPADCAAPAAQYQRYVGDNLVQHRSQQRNATVDVAIAGRSAATRLSAVSTSRKGRRGCPFLIKLHRPKGEQRPQ
jgi:hypothetical protein